LPADLAWEQGRNWVRPINPAATKAAAKIPLMPPLGVVEQLLILEAMDMGSAGLA
jgi:hypothetical protein